MANPPFGTYSLPIVVERIREAADSLEDGPIRRRVISLARRVCLLAKRDPHDVRVFGGLPVRLYPRGNYCERRVFLGVNTWDKRERMFLAGVIRGKGAGEPFVFVDAGANVGLYSMFVLGEARRRGCPARILAIEPDPVNLGRLRANIALAGAGEIAVAACALGASETTGRLLSEQKNRGEVRLAEAHETAPAEVAEVNVAVRPLADVLAEHKISRVDALKIDIEGAEHDMLRAFFAHAPREVWPGVILLETQGGRNADAVALCQASGYSIAAEMRRNMVLSR